VTDQPPSGTPGTGGTRTPRPDLPAATGATSNTEAAGGTPRWVKGFAIVGVALVLMIIVMLLTGHGPGRHLHTGLGVHPALTSRTAGGGTARGGDLA
jgi:hypothetical protein